jgi:hypothetical protein
MVLYDLRVVRAPEADGPIDLSLGADPGYASGREYLAQQVVLELLSDPLLSGRGSGYLTVLKQGAASPEAVVVGRAREALSLAKANITAYQSEETDLSSDERLASLRLVRLVRIRDRWRSVVEIVSESGQAESVTVG